MAAAHTPHIGARVVRAAVATDPTHGLVAQVLGWEVTRAAVLAFELALLVGKWRER